MITGKGWYGVAFAMAGCCCGSLIVVSIGWWCPWYQVQVGQSRRVD
jgi:hypothetical protein